MDKISVIIPFYKTEKFIVQAIDSVKNQTYTNWEAIIILDGPNRILNKLKSIAADDNRIIIIALEKNVGVSKARNHGINAASGRFIAFLDSDDLWHPEKLEVQVSFMLQNQIDLSFTAYHKINEEGVIIKQVKVPKQVSYNDLLKTNYMGCSTVMYDSKILGKVLMPTNTKREDFATWLKILKTIKYAYAIERSLMSYRIHADQNSMKKIEMGIANWKLYRRVEGLGLLKTLNVFIHYSLNGIKRTFIDS